MSHRFRKNLETSNGFSDNREFEISPAWAMLVLVALILLVTVVK